MIPSHGRYEILIDTNLLILYLVGLCDPNLIASFSRTRSRGYTLEDFEILSLFLSRFERIVTTPNILTEVGNLLNELHVKAREKVYAILALVLAQIEERYVRSAAVVRSPHIAQFGLTDLGIAELAGEETIVMTDDGRAAHYLGNHGVRVLNFNAIRSMDW